ncbi:MAG: glycosyltransferase family 39 protein, partial [Caldilinea sp.]
MNKSIAPILAGIILFALIVLPRIPGVDLAVSPDEPKWLARSANFYRALATQDWAGTFQVEHPGVTVMYTGMTSFLAQYPELAANAPAPFAWDSRQIEDWLAGHTAVTPLALLVGGRWAVILLTAVLLMLSFLPLRRLFGATGAIFAVLFASWSPFGLSLTQRLHPDSLLAVFLLLALTAFLTWLYAGRALRYLLLSAVATALAGLTKTPAIFLVATAGLLTALDWWRTERTLRRALSSVLLLAGWGLLAVVIFVVLWPTMWVQPVETIRQILAGMSVHAEGHSNPNFFWGEIVEDPGWFFYPVVLLFRATPATVIGVVAACVLLFTRNAPAFRSRTSRDALVGLMLFAVIFLAGMSLGAKKSDRYALPALLALDVVAAIGWLGVAQIVWQQAWMASLRQRFAFVERAGLALVAALGLILLHIAPALYHAPYYFTYFNPLVGGVRTAPAMLVIGWGEGLDQAGVWLNEYDQGKARSAVSAYATGSFSYYYDHHVFTYASNLRRDWLDVGYAVTYANQWQRDLPDVETIRFFAAHTPIHVYSFRGLELARVYDLVETLLPPNSEIDSQRIVDFGEAMRLLDFKISPEVKNPGDSGEVELYLKNIKPMENNASVILRLLAPNGDEVWRS